MPPEVANPYLDRAGRANGMILLTGPTGSGKTTTLYATLSRIGTPGLNVMTIEDPIEYELSGPGAGAAAGLSISQSQVNPRKGITFATGLRHILRQDPDVVMVGEIRDEETARIAVQASLTGHLVFSTLHTNDAASAITRLIDLGIEPYLVSASISAVLAQRLVRKLHPPCKGAGCDECLKTGFRGRTGLFELIVIEEGIRELISSEAQLAQIRQAARSAGTRTLREDGEHLAQTGITTIAEVHRVVHGAF
jgi:type II secretory ATPase GspE/PulE/Tfp pilus assembly ATPase PilB-like protein